MPQTPFAPPTFAAPPAPAPFEPSTAPAPTPPARTVITALTGGGSNALDGQLTMLWHLGEFVIVLADGLAVWQLQAGTQATDTVAGYVRPADFHAVDNAKVFTRVHWQGKIDAEAAAALSQLYRDQAQAAQGAAAASATQAALVVASQFKGGAAGNAVPASLTAAGEWVVITSDGTSHAINWTRGDRAHWTGVAGSYVRVPGQLIDEIRVLQGDSSRQVAGYAQCDGATASRAAGIYGPFDAATNRRGWLPGASALDLLIWVDVPTVNPTVSNANLWISTDEAMLGISRPWTMGAGIKAGTADLVLWANGATPASDYRTATVPDFRSTYSGRRVPLRIRFTQGSTAPRIWAFSTELIPTLTDGAGADPDWLSASMVSTWHVVGLNWPTGVAPQVVPVLGTLTDADIDAWRISGQIPAWVARGGAARRFVSDMSSTAGWVLTGTSSIAGGKLTIPNDGSVAFFGGASGFQSWLTGDKCSFTLTIDSISGGGSLAYWNGTAYVSFASAPGTYTVEFTWTNSYTGGPGLRINGGSGGSAVIDDYTGTVFGALTIPVAQPCLVLGDGTHLGDNQGRLLGCLPITDRQTWRIVARTHLTGAAQDVQLLGGPLLLEANRSRIDSIAVLQNSGGALNLALGSASGGSDIAASTSIASGNTPTDVAPTLRYPPTQNLWARRVAGAGVGPFTITVEGHRIGGNP